MSPGKLMLPHVLTGEEPTLNQPKVAYRTEAKNDLRCLFTGSS